jgi:hypothetical protein
LEVQELGIRSTAASHDTLLDINGDGKWAVTTNWLDKKNPTPRCWQPWPGTQLIHGALKDTDDPEPSKNSRATAVLRGDLSLVPGAAPQALRCLNLKPGKLPERQGPPDPTGASRDGRAPHSHARNSGASGGSNHRSPTRSLFQTSSQHGS